MLFVVLGAFFLGWGIQSIRPVSIKVPQWLDLYVLRFALPALIIAKISRVTLDEGVVLPIVIAWIVMSFSVVIVFALARIFHWSRNVVGALLLVGVLGNTSFLGLGMVESLLGQSYVASAIAYDQIGTFVGLSIWGSFVASTYGIGQSGWRPVLSRLIRFGPFIALLICIPLRSVELPKEVYDLLQLIGTSVAPVAMCSLGLRFTLRVSRSVATPAILGLCSKMFLMPAMVILCAHLLSSQADIAWSASVLQAAAPPMVTAGVVAVGAGLSEDLVTFMVGVGTLLAFVSLPLLSLVL